MANDFFQLLPKSVLSSLIFPRLVEFVFRIFVVWFRLFVLLCVILKVIVPKYFHLLCLPISFYKTQGMGFPCSFFCVSLRSMSLHTF